jgi:hypothetical protein
MNYHLVRTTKKGSAYLTDTKLEPLIGEDSEPSHLSLSLTGEKRNSSNGSLSGISKNLITYPEAVCDWQSFDNEVFGVLNNQDDQDAEINQLMYENEYAWPPSMHENKRLTGGNEAEVKTQFHKILDEIFGNGILKEKELLIHSETYQGATNGKSDIVVTSTIDKEERSKFIAEIKKLRCLTGNETVFLIITKPSNLKKITTKPPHWAIIYFLVTEIGKKSVFKGNLILLYNCSAH